MRYFIAPRSGERSYRNFQSTIKHGVPYYRIESYLTPEGKEILSAEEVVYAWGNRKAKQAAWNRMSIGDTVLFYARYNFIMAGKLIYKQHSPELALAMWPPDEHGNPWEYTFFLNDLKYVRIPIRYFNEISGYHFTSVQGFQEIEKSHVDQILHHFASFNDLFEQFKDASSDEIPTVSEPVHVNVTKSVNAEFLTNFRLQPYAPSQPKEQNSKAKPKIVDFEAKHRENARTGSLGEELVLKSEQDYLTRLGRHDLAVKVKRVSLEDISLGYDVLSFDRDGHEKYIEVKSTTLPKNKYFQFNISSNEKRIAERTENYYVYLVFDVRSEKPKIVALKNPFVLKEYLVVEPTQFIVKGYSN